MKKSVVLILGLLLIPIILLSVSVLAAPDMQTIVSGIQDFFKPILTAIFGEGTQIFEQLLFALIVIAAVYMALERVPVVSQNSFALWTITIVSAILAVRFIATQKIVDLLLLPQGVMGIALLSIIPFVVYFWFVEFGLSGAGSRVLRKICWVVYGAVWVVIWYKQVYTGTNAVLKEWGWIYLLAAAGSFALLLIDGTIQNALRRSQGKAWKESDKDIVTARLSNKIAELNEQLAGSGLTAQQEQAILDRIKVLEKRMENVRRM